jgi:hypothetical protein
VYQFGMSRSLPPALESGVFRLDFTSSKKNTALEAKLSEFPRWSSSRRTGFQRQLINSWLYLKFASRLNGHKLSLILETSKVTGVWNPTQKRLSIWLDIYELASKEGSSSNANLPRFFGVVLREMGVQSSLQDLQNLGLVVSFTRVSATTTPLTQPPITVKPTPSPAILPSPLSTIKPTPIKNAPLPTMTQLQTPGFVQKPIAHNETLQKGEQYVLTMSANASLASKQLKDFQNALDKKFGQGTTQAKRFTSSGNTAEVLFMVVRQPELSPVIGGKEIAPVVLTALAIIATLGVIWAITLTIERIAILVNDTTKKSSNVALSLGSQVQKVGLGISAALLGTAALWYVFIRK